MESIFLQYKSSCIHYCKAGHGNKLLLCFHGYSKSSESFYFLEKNVELEFTFIAIDFPFHGKTIWKEGLHFTPENLLEIIYLIVAGLSLSTEKIYLIGFSMGGRAALSLLEYIPSKIEKLVLLAPDGFRVNFWYWLATQNKAGNKLFKHIMQKPALMFHVLKSANKIQLVNQSIYKFINTYIHDNKVRDDLYKRWTTMSRFRPHIKKIKSIIKEYKVPVNLLYGEHDRIIRFERAENFREGIEPYCKLQIIPGGHQLLNQQNAETIMGMLKN